MYPPTPKSLDDTESQVQQIPSLSVWIVTQNKQKSVFLYRKHWYNYTHQDKYLKPCGAEVSKPLPYSPGALPVLDRPLRWHPLLMFTVTSSTPTFTYFISLSFLSKRLKCYRMCVGGFLLLHRPPPGDVSLAPLSFLNWAPRRTVSVC